LGLRVLLPVYTFLIEAVVWVALVPALWVHARLTRSARVELAQRLDACRSARHRRHRRGRSSCTAYLSVR
jgi:hypothetical protein